MGKVMVFVGGRNGAVAAVETRVELNRVLENLRRRSHGKHFLVRLVNVDNDELMLGIGPQFGLVSITPVSQEVVFNALGDDPRPNTLFEWGGHELEMGPDNLLPVLMAKEIAARWMTDGTRDTMVRWEESPTPRGPKSN